MELVIDVGNSETVLGIVDPGTLDLREHWRLSTPIPARPMNTDCCSGHCCTTGEFRTTT